MKIRVSNATNIQLDWLVAKCTGKNGVLHDDGITRCIVIAAASGVYKGTFKPTENWSLGGPLIEREGLHLRKSGCEWQCDYWNESTLNFDTSYGPTPLIAAMRCFVASKLGDEVEVPEELL